MDRMYRYPPQQGQAMSMFRRPAPSQQMAPQYQGAQPGALPQGVGRPQALPPGHMSYPGQIDPGFNPPPGATNPMAWAPAGGGGWQFPQLGAGQLAQARGGAQSIFNQAQGGGNTQLAQARQGVYDQFNQAQSPGILAPPPQARSPQQMAQREAQNLSAKLADPNLDPAQRARVEQRMEFKGYEAQPSRGGPAQGAPQPGFQQATHTLPNGMTAPGYAQSAPAAPPPPRGNPPGRFQQASITLPNGMVAPGYAQRPAAATPARGNPPRARRR